MIDPIADLRAELAAAKDDIARLRAQLAAGMGVPDPAGNAGKALTVVGTVPAWTTLPVPVTSVGAAAPITTTGGATPTIGHANSGVAAGTYTLPTITVDARGHITGASSGTGGSATWGSISGTLSSQTDLQAALDAKGGLIGGNAWSGLQDVNGAVFARSAVTPSSGAGTLVFYSLGTGYVRSYNFGTSAYTPLNLEGSTVALRYQTTPRVTVNATGVQLAGDVSVTGGAMSLASPLALASGGTGATTAAAARTALGLSGAITVSSAAPSGGVDGDIWLQW